MTALKAPEQVACVVSVNGVTNLFSHMGRYDRDTDSYRYWERYAGASAFSPDAEKAQITPLERTHHFKSPVLMFHGREDTTVEYFQGSAFKKAWGNRPGLTFVKWDSADHYLRTQEMRHDLLETSLAFLSTHHPVIDE